MNIASHATGLRFSGAANGSITHLVVNGDEWTVRCFNDTSHLGVRFSGSDSDL
jgi:probable phosphoglycerate mutase